MDTKQLANVLAATLAETSADPAGQCITGLYNRGIAVCY